MSQHQTCRFCGAITFDTDSGVRYARRHWAHFRCYLAKGKPIAKLQPWQVGRFPYKLLVEFEKMDEAKQIMDRAARAA